MKLHSVISVEAARELAEYEAGRVLEGVVPIPSRWLRNECVEADGCWIFFRRADLMLSPHQALSDCAFAVSKRGTLRLIANFIDDRVKLQSYLTTISSFFLDNNL